MLLDSYAFDKGLFAIISPMLVTLLFLTFTYVAMHFAVRKAVDSYEGYGQGGDPTAQ
jgi:hypothetical protein